MKELLCDRQCLISAKSRRRPPDRVQNPAFGHHVRSNEGATTSFAAQAASTGVPGETPGDANGSAKLEEVGGVAAGGFEHALERDAVHVGEALGHTGDEGRFVAFSAVGGRREIG